MPRPGLYMYMWRVFPHNARSALFTSATNLPFIIPIHTLYVESGIKVIIDDKSRHDLVVSAATLWAPPCCDRRHDHESPKTQGRHIESPKMQAFYVGPVAWASSNMWIGISRLWRIF